MRWAVRTWVAQGTGDEICPEVFAQQLVEGLKGAGVPHTAYFFDAGHSAKSDGMSRMLRMTCTASHDPRGEGGVGGDQLDDLRRGARFILENGEQAHGDRSGRRESVQAVEQGSHVPLVVAFIVLMDHGTASISWISRRSFPRRGQAGDRVRRAWR